MHSQDGWCWFVSFIWACLLRSTYWGIPKSSAGNVDTLHRGDFTANDILLQELLQDPYHGSVLSVRRSRGVPSPNSILILEKPGMTTLVAYSPRDRMNAWIWRAITCMAPASSGYAYETPTTTSIAPVTTAVWNVMNGTTASSWPWSLNNPLRMKVSQCRVKSSSMFRSFTCLLYVFDDNIAFVSLVLLSCYAYHSYWFHPFTYP